nr:hypothetical protein [Tanacetum cinerariifolium]
MGTDPTIKLRREILDIRSVLTQKGLNIFCRSFHIPDYVHPQLPSPNQTIHEMPTGNIGVYARFFEFANFRSPLSTFLVNVLRHYHINLSQLSVIATTKVSHFEILCRVHCIEPTVGLFRCFYVNSKNKGWMSFSKRPDSDAVCYTKLIDLLKRWNDHFFWDDSFACLASLPWHTRKNVSKDHFPKSTEFNAHDYAVMVAHLALLRKFSEPFLCLIRISRYYTLNEDTYLTFLRDDGMGGCLLLCIVVDPTKVKVRERERVEGEARILDSTIRRVVPFLPVASARAEIELEATVERLFDEGGSVDQHPEFEVCVAAVATFPMITSSVSATPEHESSPPTDSITGINLRTLGTVKPTASGSSHVPGVPDQVEFRGNQSSGDPVKILAHRDYRLLLDEFNVGTVHQACLNVEVRIRTEYYLSKMRRLESECEKQVDSLKVRDAETESLKDQLLLEETKAAKILQSSVSTKDLELKELNIVVFSLRSQKDGLVGYEHIEEFQDAQMNIVNDKVEKLHVDLLEMALHLEEKFNPHLLNTISGRRWLLTHGLKLAIIKCLNSYKYLSAVGANISCAIEKRMHDGLSADIDHRKAGRSLEDVATYNPSAEADYTSAL